MVELDAGLGVCRVHLAGTIAREPSKSESRDPKSEGNPKPETRTAAHLGSCLPALPPLPSGSGFRILGETALVVLTGCARVCRRGHLHLYNSGGLDSTRSKLMGNRKQVHSPAALRAEGLTDEG
jgi:hypothetical protein